MCELFDTCIHESGHLFALQSFGGNGYIVTFTQPVKTELEDIIGRVVCTKEPPIINQTRKVNVIVGLAGKCAELMHYDPTSEFLAYDLEDVWEYDYDTISCGDKKLTKTVTFNEFDDCAKLIKENYSFILAMAKIEYAKHSSCKGYCA